MHFLWVNVTFNQAVNMMHDIVRTAYAFPYTAKFMSGLEIIKRNKSDIERQMEYIHVHSVVVYQNTKKLSIFPTLLDIFDIQQHYIHILYLANQKLCCFQIEKILESRQAWHYKW